MGHLRINLVVLVVVVVLNGEDLPIHEEDVFVPILGMPLKEPLCLSVGSHSEWE
jgi:hypothetical protein